MQAVSAKLKTSQGRSILTKDIIDNLKSAALNALNNFHWLNDEHSENNDHHFEAWSNKEHHETVLNFLNEYARYHPVAAKMLADKLLKIYSERKWECENTLKLHNQIYVIKKKIDDVLYHCDSIETSKAEVHEIAHRVAKWTYNWASLSQTEIQQRNEDLVEFVKLKGEAVTVRPIYAFNSDRILVWAWRKITPDLLNKLIQNHNADITLWHFVSNVEQFTKRAEPKLQWRFSEKATPKKTWRSFEQFVWDFGKDIQDKFAEQREKISKMWEQEVRKRMLEVFRNELQNKARTVVLNPQENKILNSAIDAILDNNDKIWLQGASLLNEHNPESFSLSATKMKMVIKMCNSSFSMSPEETKQMAIYAFFADIWDTLVPKAILRKKPEELTKFERGVLDMKTLIWFKIWTNDEQDITNEDIGWDEISYRYWWALVAWALLHESENKGVYTTQKRHLTKEVRDYWCVPKNILKVIKIAWVIDKYNEFRKWNSPFTAVLRLNDYFQNKMPYLGSLRQFHNNFVKWASLFPAVGEEFVLPRSYMIASWCEWTIRVRVLEVNGENLHLKPVKMNNSNAWDYPFNVEISSLLSLSTMARKVDNNSWEYEDFGSNLSFGEAEPFWESSWEAIEKPEYLMPEIKKVHLWRVEDESNDKTKPIRDLTKWKTYFELPASVKLVPLKEYTDHFLHLLYEIPKMLEWTNYLIAGSGSLLAHGQSVVLPSDFDIIFPGPEWEDVKGRLINAQKNWVIHDLQFAALDTGETFSIDDPRLDEVRLTSNVSFTYSTKRLVSQVEWYSWSVARWIIYWKKSATMNIMNFRWVDVQFAAPSENLHMYIVNLVVEWIYDTSTAITENKVKHAKRVDNILSLLETDWIDWIQQIISNIEVAVQAHIEAKELVRLNTNSLQSSSAYIELFLRSAPNEIEKLRKIKEMMEFDKERWFEDIEFETIDTREFLERCEAIRLELWTMFNVISEFSSKKMWPKEQREYKKMLYGFNKIIRDRSSEIELSRRVATKEWNARCCVSAFTVQRMYLDSLQSLLNLTI